MNNPMLKFFSMSHRRARAGFTQLRAGFTLIELLVVIAIIGILASIVVASLNTARKKSRDARRIADVKQIQLALELYFDAAKGPSGSGTTASYPGDSITNLTTTLVSNYIPKVPVDPTSSGIYVYAYEGLQTSAGTACTAAGAVACLYYQLGAVLEDPNNPAVTQSDADKDLSAAGGLDGNDADCNTTAGAGTDACYDVTP